MFDFDLSSFVDLSIIENITPILVASLVGGLIGLEREYHDKSAGFRTMILIAVGSCLFTMLSSVMGTQYKEVTRIAASVVSGVGFLGAGVILKEGATIHGLTTAAAIWLVASLGMGAGIGQYELVITVTVLIMVVLWLFPPFERWVDRLHEFLEIKIMIKNTDKAEAELLETFKAFKIKVVHVRRSRETKTERVLYIKAKLTPAKRARLSKALVSDKSILAFDA